MLDLSYFNFKKTIGMGTFGKVYLVSMNHKIGTGNYYALKVMNKPELLKLRQVNHVNNEQRLLAMCRGHPFIVKLLLTFKTVDHFCMLMEYVPGGELFTWLKRYKRFTTAVVRFYAAQICFALGFLHERNVVYRDLKPENIMLNRDGYIKLADLGFAKELNVLTYTVCGTPEYLAPEQLIGEGYGIEVDYWSFGIVLYEMAVGIPPFYANSALKIYDNIANEPVKIPSFVPSDLADIIRLLLVKNKYERLGAKKGFVEIMDHVFFKDLEWDKIYNKQIPPPIIPVIKSTSDTSNFVNYAEASKKENIIENPYKYYTFY